MAVIFKLENTRLAGLPMGLKAWPLVASRKETMGREYIMAAVGGVSGLAAGDGRLSVCQASLACSDRRQRCGGSAATAGYCWLQEERRQ